jgi:cyclic-di-GMP-binding protein
LRHPGSTKHPATLGAILNFNTGLTHNRTLQGREIGAGNEARTRDLNLGKVALYQLSYSRTGTGRSLKQICAALPSVFFVVFFRCPKAGEALAQLLALSSMTLDIRIPAQRKPSKDSFDVRLKAVDRWIHSLPLANLGETSRRVYKALLEINGLIIGTKDRQAVLRVLHPTIEHVVSGLRKHYIGQTFPLLDKNRNVVELAQEVLSEMAMGYKIVVAQCIADNARANRKLLPYATVYALHYLAGILLETYEVYAPSRQSVWREIHQLYLLAETRGYNQEALSDQDLAETSVSVEEIYRRITVLAAAGPYRLRQGEVRRVYQWLSARTHRTRLASISDPDAQHAIYYIRFDSDDPPTALRPDNSQMAPQQSRALVTHPLLDTVNQEIARLAPDVDTNVGAAAQIDLLRRLGAAWAAFSKRRFTRKDLSAEINVIVGLDSIHHFCHNLMPSSQTPSRVINEPIELWDLTAYRTSYDRLSLTPHVYPPKNQTGNKSNTNSNSEFSIQDWQLRNTSAGGYCLLWDKQQTCKTQVGELLGIREKSDAAATWRICAVRWMKTRRGKGLEIGIQILSPHAEAGTLAAKKRQDADEGSRCLVTPEISPLNLPATIITSAMLYQPGNVLTLQTQEHEQTVRLTRLIEHTGHFAVYEYVTLEKPANELPSETATLDFESLWTSI